MRNGISNFFFIVSIVVQYPAIELKLKKFSYRIDK